MGAIVEEVRTVFERRNDATIYIPNFNQVVMWFIVVLTLDLDESY